MRAPGLPLELRLLTYADSDRLHAVNRACPIDADFTFYFDRTPTFFAWPDAVFDGYVYVGGFRRDELVAYALFASALGHLSPGDRYAWSGDVRVVPEARGSGFLDAAVRVVVDEVPPSGVGLALVKRGNVAAMRAIGALRPPGVEISRLCEYQATSLLLLRRRHRRARCSVRRAGPEDVPAMVDLMRRAWRDRPFAPLADEEELVRDAGRLPGFGIDRYYLASDRGDLVGALGAWDADAVRRITILRETARARTLRAAHAGLRLLFRSGSPLPSPGRSFRAITATRVAVPDGDPRVLHDLLSAVAEDHVDRGYHLIHVGFAGADPLRAGTRGFLRQSFWSDLLVTAPVGRADALRSGPLPYIDLRFL